MKRYITEQPHMTSCGPVAVMNVLKWLGYSITYRNSINGFKELGWDRNGRGTSCYDLSGMLHAYGVKFKLHKKGTTEKLKKIVNKGNVAIIAYDWATMETSGAHYLFVDYHWGQWFGAYNVHAGKETGMLHEDCLESWFLLSKKHRKKDKSSNKWMPCIWEIEKE